MPRTIHEEMPLKVREFFRKRAEAFVARMKRTSFPGFDGIPVYDVMTFFFEEIRRDQLTMRAAAISYNLLLAIFPSLIFLFTLIPYIPVQDLNYQLIELLKSVLPPSGFDFLADTIDDIMNTKRVELLSSGFILAFYFSTNGVRGLMRAFNKNHPIYKRRNFWSGRLAAFKLTFYLFILFIISITLIIAGDDFIHSISSSLGWHDALSLFVLKFVKWIIIILLFFTGISLIYYYGPTHRWRFMTPGATFATIGSIIASLAFGFFVNNFGRYNEVYGFIGTLIVLMAWINLNSFMLLVGFEINNSIDVNRVLRQKLKETDVA